MRTQGVGHFAPEVFEDRRGPVTQACLDELDRPGGAGVIRGKLAHIDVVPNGIDLQGIDEADIEAQQEETTEETTTESKT